MLLLVLLLLIIMPMLMMLALTQMLLLDSFDVAAYSVADDAKATIPCKGTLREMKD